MSLLFAIMGPINIPRDIQGKLQNGIYWRPLLLHMLKSENKMTDNKECISYYFPNEAEMGKTIEIKWLINAIFGFHFPPPPKSHK